MGLLDDIVGNKELGDDLTFEIGNHKVPLGELRGLHGQLTEREQRLQSLSSERDGLRGKYDELAGTMTRLLGQADQAVTRENEAPAPKSPADTLREALEPLLQGQDPAEPLFQDKVFGQFANRITSKVAEKYDAELAKLTDSFTALKDLVNNGFQAVTAAQVGESERRWYGLNKSDLPKGQDGKTVSLDQMRNYAAQNGFFQVNQQGQPTNLLDLDRALNALTEPTRRQSEIETAKREAYEQGMREGRTAAGKVIPFMSERSAGGMPKEQYDTKGKSARQIVQERLKQGLAELSEEASNQ